VGYGIAPFVASLFDATLTVGQTQIIAIRFVVLCAIINLIGVRLTAAMARIGAIAEVARMLLLTLVLLVMDRHQPVGVLVHSGGLPPG
jgi:amino acid transporter